MAERKRQFMLSLLAGCLLSLLAAPAPSLAQSSSGSAATIRLYVDPSTHIVYTVPGRGRRLLTEIPASALEPTRLEQQQQKTEAQLRQNQQQISELAERNRRLEASNGELTRQMAEIRPAWRSYIENFQDKFRIGTVFYGDYRFYTHTGFQPQELTQITNPGPGNNLYNSFDINRTYLNIYFFPTKDWMLRLTPNIYKTIGSSNVKVGQVTGFGSNLDGNLGVRMKYAMLQYANLWNDVPVLKGGTVSIGEIPNPLVAWEEDLYGFRYVNLIPWNYYSLSSTQVGLSMEGPIKPWGGEAVYVDYGFGVYTNANFHAFEQTNTKEVMGRITVYPFGAYWRFQGLGLTGFYNYGYGNTAPDTADLPATLKGPDAHITRIAALLHYTAEQWGLAGEFDYGTNAFSAANLFSGSGPADAFGFGPTKYAPFSSLATALLNNGQAHEVGLAGFGHYHIPGTPLTAFGMFKWWMPNDKVRENPLDFQSFAVGVSYQYNEFLRFALDSQNLSYYHGQFGFPVAYAKTFGFIPPKGFKGDVIPDAVPRDVHAIFLNVEYSY